MRARVLYSRDLDVAAWATRHHAGAVPDALPYGLDRMAGPTLQVLAPPSPPRVPGVVRAAIRKAGAQVDWCLTATRVEDCDAVLAWDERAGTPVALRHGRRLPVITGLIWGTDRPPIRPLLAGMQQGLRRAAAVFVLSEAQVVPAMRIFGIAPHRIHAVPFGVDVDFYAPTAEPIDRDLVVSVGNDRDRDFPSTLRAFAEVRRRRPSTRLVLVSRSVPRQAVEGIDGVELVPHLGHADLRSLLSRAALSMTLLQPNLHVSGITAVLETLALGRPAVATGTAGMAQYQDGGRHLTLLPPGDWAAAARKCLDVLADPDAADELGAQGRASVRSSFSSEGQARALAQIVLSAAG